MTDDLASLTAEDIAAFRANTPPTDPVRTYRATASGVTEVFLPHGPDELPRLLEVVEGETYELADSQFVQLPTTERVVPPELEEIP